MRRNQGYYLSKSQNELLTESQHLGMNAEMLRHWERHPNEERKSELKQTYLSMSVEVPANFSSYHKDAALIMLRHDFRASEAIAELNQIKKHEAKAFVMFHHLGLTLKFIRENRDKFFFNHATIQLLKLLMDNEHITFQQALDEIEGMEPWLYDVVIDFHHDGLRCEDIRELLTSRETESIVRNACLEYSMYKDPRWSVSFISDTQFIHFVKNVMHGAMKQGASAQDAWLLTAGQLQQIALAYNFSKNIFWNAPRGVQAEYLMTGFRDGIQPENIPLFTREFWKTYLVLRSLHHLSSAEAIGEIRGVCRDLTVEPAVWWTDAQRNEFLIRRIDAKMEFLRDHYCDGIRGKDLAGCPFAKNAVKECMEKEKIGAKRTLALLNEMEPENAQYLMVYSSLGVSLQTIASVDFLHEPSLEEVETFTALVERMGMKPDMAFKRITNQDEETLQYLLEDANRSMWLDAEKAAEEDGQRMRM